MDTSRKAGTTARPGPWPLSHGERLETAKAIADRALAVHGAAVLAIGLYGSTAKGTDGPFSDIEMMCILEAPETNYSAEWCTPHWKAEVNFVDRERVLIEAATVEGNWALTHGSYIHTLALFDPTGFLAKLREVALAPAERDIARAMRDLIVHDLYEVAGKLRNAAVAGLPAAGGLLGLAWEEAQLTAHLVGLAARTPFSTGTRVLVEALCMPPLPDGFAELCALLGSGDLADAHRTLGACERLWQGVVAWAAARGLAYLEARRIPF